MNQDITIVRDCATMNLGPVESVTVGQTGSVLVQSASGAVIMLPSWVIEGIDGLARCNACHRIAHLRLSECPDYRH